MNTSCEDKIEERKKKHSGKIYYFFEINFSGVKHKTDPSHLERCKIFHPILTLYRGKLGGMLSIMVIVITQQMGKREIQSTGSSFWLFFFLQNLVP